MEILYQSDYFDSNKAVSILPRLPQPEFPEHTHDFHELVLIKSGSGLHFIDGRPHLVGKGALFYIPAGQVHYFDHIDDLCLTNVVFAPEQLQTKALMSFLPQCASAETASRISTATLRECEILLAAMSTECGKSDECSSPMVESLFSQLIVLLWRDRESQQSAVRGDDKVAALVNYLNQNYSEDIDFETLAERFDIPLRTMARRVADLTGLSPNNYLGRVRLCQAMRLLQQSTVSITDVAYSCGFNDSNYFSSRFHHEIGMTPKQFRLQNQSDLGRRAILAENLAANIR